MAGRGTAPKTEDKQQPRRTPLPANMPRVDVHHEPESPPARAAGRHHVPADRSFVYLSLVTGAWSRKIVGHYVHDSLHTEQVSRALRWRSGFAKRDRGWHITRAGHSVLLERLPEDPPRPWHRVLDEHDCYQNALAKRVNGILKMKVLRHRPAPPA